MRWKTEGAMVLMSQLELRSPECSLLMWILPQELSDKQAQCPRSIHLRGQECMVCFPPHASSRLVHLQTWPTCCLGRHPPVPAQLHPSRLQRALQKFPWQPVVQELSDKQAQAPEASTCGFLMRMGCACRQNKPGLALCGPQRSPVGVDRCAEEQALAGLRMSYGRA